MKKIIIFSLAIVILLFFSTFAKAQIDSIMNGCTRYLQSPYISDGQQYRALLGSNEETAEFRSTFYGGSIYRIVVCGTVSQDLLVFSLYDTKRNLLFTNRDFQNTPYWDFEFQSTTECVIEAQFDETTDTSGFVILLIGFKQ